MSLQQVHKRRKRMPVDGAGLLFGTQRPKDWHGPLILQPLRIILELLLARPFKRGDARYVAQQVVCEHWANSGDHSSAAREVSGLERGGR